MILKHCNALFVLEMHFGYFVCLEKGGKLLEEVSNFARRERVKTLEWNTELIFSRTFLYECLR